MSIEFSFMPFNIIYLLLDVFEPNRNVTQHVYTGTNGRKKDWFVTLGVLYFILIIGHCKEL